MSVIEMVEDVSNDRIYTLATLGFIVGGSYLTWFKGNSRFNAPFTIGCVMLGVALVADWNFNRKANSRSSAWEAEYRDEELLYKDEFESMRLVEREALAGVLAGRPSGAIFAATRVNEPDVTYFVRHEPVGGEALYRILWIEEPEEKIDIATFAAGGWGGMNLAGTVDDIEEMLGRKKSKSTKRAIGSWAAEDWQKSQHKGTKWLWCFNCGEYSSPEEQDDVAVAEAALDYPDEKDNCPSCGDPLTDLESTSYEEYAAESGEWDKIEWYMDTMTTQGKHTASPILETLLRSDDQTKAEALDWLINNYYIHADEQWNAAYILALADALDIQHDFEQTLSGAAESFSAESIEAEEVMCNSCHWGGSDSELKTFTDEYGRHSGCPKCESDNLIGFGNFVGKYAESFAVEAYDEKMTVWICGGCNSRFEDQNDAEDCCEGIPEDELYHHDPKSRDARKVHLQGGKQGDWRAEAMSPSAVVAKKGRVRTASGKPHTPRKLKKDQNLTPEEARKRVRFEASQNPPAEAFNPAELVGEQLVRPDGPMTADQAQGFMTNLRRYRKQMAAEDTDAAANVALEDWEDIIMEISVEDELFDDLAYYFPNEWYDIFLSAYDDPEVEGYQILIIHEDDFDIFIEMRDSLRYLPPSPAREIKEGINLEAFWDEEMETKP